MLLGRCSSPAFFNSVGPLRDRLRSTMPTPERMPVMADATICCRPGRPHASVQIKFPRTCRPPSRPSGGRRIPPPQQQAKFPLNRQPARPKKPPAPSVSRRAAPAGGRLIPSEPEHPRSRGAGRRRGSPVVNSPAPFIGRGAPRMAKRAQGRRTELAARPRVRPFRRSRPCVRQRRPHRGGEQRGEAGRRGFHF